MHAIVRRRLPAVVAIAVIAAPAWHMRGARQTAPAPRPAFAKRVVTTGLADPFQTIFGPDDYLWVTERTAGRITRVLPSNGSKTAAIVIAGVLSDGPGGVLGMALDPGLLKGTTNDYVYVAYTYDADADPVKVARRAKIVRLAYDPRAHVLGKAMDILVGLPAGTDHQGGRLVIGPIGGPTIGDRRRRPIANLQPSRPARPRRPAANARRSALRKKCR
jgi:glucose/arabinose dehydrogenase